jgi:hypothetical protein
MCLAAEQPEGSVLYWSRSAENKVASDGKGRYSKATAAKTHGVEVVESNMAEVDQKVADKAATIQDQSGSWNVSAMAAEQPLSADMQEYIADYKMQATH